MWVSWNRVNKVIDEFGKDIDLHACICAMCSNQKYDETHDADFANAPKWDAKFITDCRNTLLHELLDDSTPLLGWRVLVKYGATNSSKTIHI
jgi:hypothetical protein